MGNSDSQIDDSKSNNEQNNKYKDIEEAIQKAIDSNTNKAKQTNSHYSKKSAIK